MWFCLNCAYYKGRGRGIGVPLVPLSQPHGGEERDSRQTLDGVHLNKPLEILLKHTVALLAMLSQNGIQSGFGGVGLPSAIKQTDEVVTDLSDQVTMETDLSDAVNVIHGGVAAVPVATVSDGGVHLGFNLTHDAVVV